mmetsp:Transcript_20452/g.52484  ORF Transcript_20452/g.52484 Transcript_20452/m.52484 type:complete len:324 (-) Transcript_20452:3939-4910(-)
MERLRRAAAACTRALPTLLFSKVIMRGTRPSFTIESFIVLSPAPMLRRIAKALACACSTTPEVSSERLLPRKAPLNTADNATSIPASFRRRQFDSLVDRLRRVPRQCTFASTDTSASVLFSTVTRGGMAPSSTTRWQVEAPSAERLRRVTAACVCVIPSDDDSRSISDGSPASSMIDGAASVLALKLRTATVAFCLIFASGDRSRLTREGRARFCISLGLLTGLDERLRKQVTACLTKAALDDRNTSISGTNAPSATMMASFAGSIERLARAATACSTVFWLFARNSDRSTDTAPCSTKALLPSGSAVRTRIALRACSCSRAA